MQSCLALNRQSLLRFDIDYPCHRNFPNAIVGEVTVGNGARFPDILADLKSSSENILFSCECLFEALVGSRKDIFNCVLDSGKYTFKVIAYSRNLLSMHSLGGGK